jgi:RNA polymerase sigma-70 factor (ECF subfamily)
MGVSDVSLGHPEVVDQVESRTRSCGVDFAQWYEATYPGVLKAVLAFTRNPEAAEDASADAFAKALTRWQVVGRMEDPAGWVYRVAVNNAKRSWLRSRRREKPSGTSDAVVSMPDLDPPVWAAVDDLPRRQREVVILRYVSGLTEARIATILGITTGAVSASLTSARQRLSRDSRVVSR